MADERRRSDERQGELARIVDALCADNAPTLAAHRLGALGLPSREALQTMMHELRAALFPGHYAPTDVTVETAHYHVGALLDSALGTLEEQVRRALALSASGGAVSPERAPATVRAFAGRLPAVRALLGTDVRAAYEGDPAAKSADEAILCYPGFTAVLYQRIAHELHVLGVPLIPRIITEEAHAATGIDIHPGARIGGSFFIDHGTGVVIGETAVIGERVRIFQGVTLGAKSFPLDGDGNPVKGVDRHPIVEDDVVIYAGATILGRVTIGKGSSIGGNVWLTRSVPPGSKITQGKSQSEEI
jgi:serine O-acetyltransferase